jgi:hypothetical protein
MMKRLVLTVTIGVLLAFVGQWGVTDEKTVVASSDGEDLEPFRYKPHGSRNPFFPLLIEILEEDSTPTPTPQLVVQAEIFTPTPTPIVFPGLEIDCILWFEERPSLVVIDNALLHVGDTVDECEIVAIEKDSVRVRYMGQEKVLRATSSSAKSLRPKSRRGK